MARGGEGYERFRDTLGARTLNFGGGWLAQGLGRGGGVHYSPIAEPPPLPQNGLN